MKIATNLETGEEVIGDFDWNKPVSHMYLKL